MLEQGLSRKVGVCAREGLERLVAADGVGVGLLRGQRRLAQKVDGGSDPVLPEPSELTLRLGRRGRGDEPVRHVADSSSDGRSQRYPPSFGVRGAHRSAQRRRRLIDVCGELRQVRGEIVQVAAGGRDVYEPEQGRAQLGVVRGEPLRAIV